MSRIKSIERYFYALNYEKQVKSKLTRKQFSVYTYLLSISKWNPNTLEHHYYVYKNSFVIKEACTLLGISHQTWKAALNKLIEEHFIRDLPEGKGWWIYFPKEFAPLTTELISFLLNFSSVINNSGNLVGVYATLYRYWSECRYNGAACTITITTLLHLFDSRNTKEN